MDSDNNIIGFTYQKFEQVSSKSTPRIAKKLGFPCDVYFPIFGNVITHGSEACHNLRTNYENIDLFATHQNAEYSNTPDLVGVRFYIPHLVKKQIMNSPSNDFETFYLDEDSANPFIEVHPSEELPIQSKLVVHFSTAARMNLFIEKKTIVPGGVFLRMYLNTLV